MDGKRLIFRPGAGSPAKGVKTAPPTDRQGSVGPGLIIARSLATTKIMAFTASRGRLPQLAACIRSMQDQGLMVDHYIYLNNHDGDDRDFLARNCRWNANNTVVACGPSLHQHENHMMALALADLDKYALFLKIDDDDFYGPSYAAQVADDFVENRWDFSGSHSNGILLHGKWRPDIKMKNLAASEQDKKLGVTVTMPPTWAFTRGAIDILWTMPMDKRYWEDQQWRWALKRSGIGCHVRKESNFIYNRHSSNTSHTKRPTSSQLPS